MGAEELIYECAASNFEDIKLHYFKMIKECESHGYDSEDAYAGNATSFEGITLLNGIANNSKEAEEEILNKAEKWGPAFAKLYKSQNYTDAQTKKLLKLKKKIYKKLIEAEQKRINKIISNSENVLKKEGEKSGRLTQCFNCKSKISNAYIKTCFSVEKMYDGRLIGKNKCPVCNRPFLNLSKFDHNIKKIKEDYEKIPNVYKAIWGGIVAT
tara:strand:+ start:1854 stop:2489 length:636 start_codon:yes stop_codon:yes gene_type:complete